MRAWRRHCVNCCAHIRYLRATSATRAPGARLSRTIRPFNSFDHSRLPERERRKSIRPINPAPKAVSTFAFSFIFGSFQRHGCPSEESHIRKSARTRKINGAPTALTKKHHCHAPLDGRFRSAACLLQALWRQDRGLPIGSYVGEDGKRHKLGSRINEAAGCASGNFLTAEIAHTARREAAYREIGALIDQERLATNLLSSMPLTFNLLAPLAAKRERANSMLNELLRDFHGLACETLFEHSPGRGDHRFTGDYTAFDALIRSARDDGRKDFVAFEIKYSESMREPVPEIKPRYNELSETSELFLDPAEAALRTNPLQQLWREHLLAQGMIDNGLYDEGYFVVIAPELNHQAQDAVKAHRAQLHEPKEGKVHFVDRTREQAIRAIRPSDKDHAEALHRRYCDFWLVDAEMELNAPSFGMKSKRVAEKTAETSGEARPKPPRASPTS